MNLSPNSKQRTRRNKQVLVTLLIAYLLLLVGLSLLIGGVWTKSWFGAFGLAIVILAGTGVLAFYTFWTAHSSVLAITHARLVKKNDDPELHMIVEQLSELAKIPVPKIYTINSLAMNAFSMGRNIQNSVIVVTAGLRKWLDTEELKGIIAHEIAHIKNKDGMYRLILSKNAGIVSSTIDIFLRALSINTKRKGQKEHKPSSSLLNIILFILPVVIGLFNNLASHFIIKAISRQHEYLADLGSAELTGNPLYLARALAKLSGDTELLQYATPSIAYLCTVNPLRGEYLFETHPSLEKRIAILKDLASKE